MAKKDKPRRNKPKPKPDWQPKNLGSSSYFGEDVWSPKQIARGKRLGALTPQEAAQLRQLYKTWNEEVQGRNAELAAFNQEFGPQSYPTYPGLTGGKADYGFRGPTDQTRLSPYAQGKTPSGATPPYGVPGIPFPGGSPVSPGTPQAPPNWSAPAQLPGGSTVGGDTPVPNFSAPVRPPMIPSMAPTAVPNISTPSLTSLLQSGPYARPGLRRPPVSRRR